MKLNSSFYQKKKICFLFFDKEFRGYKERQHSYYLFFLLDKPNNIKQLNSHVDQSYIVHIKLYI